MDTVSPVATPEVPADATQASAAGRPHLRPQCDRDFRLLCCGESISLIGEATS